MGTKCRILEEEDAVLDVLCLLCNLNTRRPYGELGSVETINFLSCMGMTSELTKIVPLFPGCGSNDPTVSDLVVEWEETNEGERRYSTDQSHGGGTGSDEGASSGYGRYEG
jgi:hypothetical protein